jgi:hypothetical protein
MNTKINSQLQMDLYENKSRERDYRLVEGESMGIMSINKSTYLAINATTVTTRIS